MHCLLRAINRTILELKLGGNKNSDNPPDYQSHHTGIETSKEKLTAEYPHTINRTILELKLFYMYVKLFAFNAINRTILELKLLNERSICAPLAYQSHHTGIETIQSAYRYGRENRPINRTILELKRNRDWVI